MTDLLNVIKKKNECLHDNLQRERHVPWKVTHPLKVQVGAAVALTFASVSGMRRQSMPARGPHCTYSPGLAFGPVQMFAENMQ